MKKGITLFLITIIFIACQKQETVSSISLLDEIIEKLNGEFNNFQQCWQENTKESIHQTATDEPHQHIHCQYTKTTIAGTDDPVFQLRYTNGRDSTNILKKELHRFSKNRDQIKTFIYFIENEEVEIKDINQLSEANKILNWKKEGNKIMAYAEDKTLVTSIHNDTLYLHQSDFLKQNTKPYRMMKCRFFSGWIQYPIPEIADSIYRMGNLRIHDQGGIIPLILADGTTTDYSVELTQLVYGKQISIMKLAVYKESFDDINYNSKSISYTWTSPEAKRIGINLRKIVSGWTLIEPGYVNSNNMKK